MKRKIFSTLLALVLLLTLGLVTAVPTAADSPAVTDVGYSFTVEPDGEVVWDATEKKFGNYSVELALTAHDPVPGSWPDAARVVIPAPADTLLSDISTISFWWECLEKDPDQTYIAPPYVTFELDTTGDGSVDTYVINFVALQIEDCCIYAESVDWTERTLPTDNDYWAVISTIGGVSYADPESAEAWAVVLTTLADGTGSAVETLGEGTVLNYKVAIGQGSEVAPWPVQTVYIDDVTINETTYDLEPIFTDAGYYSVGDTIVVTVPNFVANTDSFRLNPVAAEFDILVPKDDWKVTVESDSDPGTEITVALEETGANTGVFQGSFGTAGTPPVGEDEVYVLDGAEITVTYTTSVVGWGAGTSTSTSITVKIDDTDPTIDVVSPSDGATEATGTPTISASYTGGTSGINTLSVEMLVDDVDVTDDATVTSSTVTYTPEDDLDEGSHDVTVNVADNAGNEATESWSFRIASWLVDPVISTAGDDSLDALLTVGVAVSGAAGDDVVIEVGRYASNPQPEVTPAFDMIEDGFFDVKVTDAVGATQVVIKFADPAITAESTAHVWDNLEGAWLECSDQGYNALDEYLWIKVRDDTTPNICELGGTPFAIGGEPAVEEISAYYKGYSGDAEVVETTDLLKAANDWADEVVPPDFTEPISTAQLLALANEWAATP